MVVAAHPDDETLGAGASLAEAARITLVHVTDGAELLLIARLKGFSNRARYAEARRGELERAFSLLPAETEFIPLGFRDQQAASHIAEAAKALCTAIGEANPDIILTHAFEGGHPDHDATAMAVHLAWRSLGTPAPLYEMALYHRSGGKNRFGTFIPQPDIDPVCIRLSSEAKAHKAAMLAAFASQRGTLAKFPLDGECFRPAPHYDFTAPPHPGPLYYEAHLLPMTWRLWQGLARRAVREFEDGTRHSHASDGLLRLASRLKNLATPH